MSRSLNNSWLHRFAVLTAMATLALIGIGGLVTSHEAGMAVPDWPTTYGDNMFLFPPSKWIGGILYEHTHRLWASGVGLLTTVLAVWLWLKESRAWVRWLGVAAFFAVVLQGVLGGLRVVLFKDEIGIFHAALAQLFFALVCAIALFTSRWWCDGSKAGRASRLLRRAKAGRPLWAGETPALLSWRRVVLLTTILIFAQLILGATMRHQHAGLAIPDFPLAYGKVWPATDARSVELYNQQRQELTAFKPITAFQIGLQMVHRIVAVLILICVGATAWLARRWSSRFSVPDTADNLKVELQQRAVVRLSLFWLGLILAQVILGAATIWSDKAADIATAHVVVGALSLVTGAMLTIISVRCLAPVYAVSAPRKATEMSPAAFAPEPSAANTR